MRGDDKVCTVTLTQEEMNILWGLLDDHIFLYSEPDKTIALRLIEKVRPNNRPKRAGYTIDRKDD